MSLSFLLAKLKRGYIWKRIALERLTEPLHLNIASAFVALFGNFTLKVAFDLVMRPHNAYAILDAATRAKHYGITKMAICEFGVANGAGLINMALIAKKVSAITGVEIRVFGFDTGEGMPWSPVDYRDHPEHYSAGNFKMDVEKLKATLPNNAELVLGECGKTIPTFLGKLAADGYAIGYVVIDVDYYTSTVDALTLFDGSPELYLPLVHIYLDDIGDPTHHPSAGELLACEEFNARPLRKIYADPFLENRRIFRRANWIKHMRRLIVLDHTVTTTDKQEHRDLNNPYLG